MCTRFYYDNTIPELNEVAREATSTPLAQKFIVNLSKPIITNGEVRPTDIVPVYAPDKSGNKAIYPMKWGFTLPLPKSSNMSKSGSLIVNARVETASVKKTFVESWAKRRCIIPCAYYFEWRHEIHPGTSKNVTKEKYMIQPVGSEVTYLAGLYRIEDGYPVFTILTTEPTKELAEIHDRMPVIMPGTAIEEWIRPDADPNLLLPHRVTDMVMERV